MSIPVTGDFHIWHNEEGKPYIRSNEQAVLVQKVEKLFEYVRNVDPNKDVVRPPIEVHPNQEGYKYQVAVESLLPRVLKHTYGPKGAWSDWAACYPTARMAAGLTPIQGIDTGEDAFHLKTERVSFQEIRPGDLVFVKNEEEKPEKLWTYPLHAYVYIDADLVLTRNGWHDEDIILQKFSEMRCMYNVGASSDEFYSQKEGSMEARVFRKKADWSYPESVIPALQNYYEALKNVTELYNKESKKPILTEVTRVFEELARREDVDAETKRVHEEMSADIKRLIEIGMKGWSLDLYKAKYAEQ